MITDETLRNVCSDKAGAARDKNSRHGACTVAAAVRVGARSEVSPALDHLDHLDVRVGSPRRVIESSHDCRRRRASTNSAFERPSRMRHRLQDGSGIGRFVVIEADAMQSKHTIASQDVDVPRRTANANDTTGYATLVGRELVGRSRPVDVEPAQAQPRVGRRKRILQRPDESIDSSGRVGPIDLPVVGDTRTAVRRGRLVLDSAGVMCDRGQRSTSDASLLKIVELLVERWTVELGRIETCRR